MAYRPSKVHLTFQSGDQWGVACMHGVNDAVIKGRVAHQQGIVMTGDPRAVTCPGCMKSAAFREVEVRMNLRPREGT